MSCMNLHPRLRKPDTKHSQIRIPQLLASQRKILTEHR